MDLRRTCGQCFNGVIASGGASVIDFNTAFIVAEPSVEIWGETDDGKPFFVRASGVGVQGAQFARVVRLPPYDAS